MRVYLYLSPTIDADLLAAIRALPRGDRQRALRQALRVGLLGQLPAVLARLSDLEAAMARASSVAPHEPDPEPDLTQKLAVIQGPWANDD